MTYTTKHLIQSFVIVPLMATTLSMNVVTTTINEAVQKAVAAETKLSPEEQKLQDEREEKAAKIDAYFAKYDLPLAGHGMHFVLVAEKNDLDPYLLPAIAMRESTGCKFIIKANYNCFGWNGPKGKFESFDHGIDIVGSHLGGNIDSTAKYYANTTLEKKLLAYNSVIPKYYTEIRSIMSKIENTTVTEA